MTDLRDIREPEALPLSPTAKAIMRYTKPGDLIVDFSCGDGRVLVEAIRADRLAIGIERSRRRGEMAREAVVQATAHGGPGFATVVVGELVDVPRLVGPDSLERASLVFIDVARVDVLGKHTRPDDQDLLERLAGALDAARQLLRVGGHVVIVPGCRAEQGSSYGELLAELADRVLTAFERRIEPVRPESGRGPSSGAILLQRTDRVLHS